MSDILEEYRLNELVKHSIPILELAGLKGSQLTFALNNICKAKTGFSPLEVGV